MIMLRSFTLALVVSFLCGTAAFAQVVGPLPQTAPSPTAFAGAESKGPQTGQSMIRGAAVDADASPLADATVRLRNLVNSQIEKVATVNQIGEFTFAVRPETPYVVELADQAGHVVAVSNVVTAHAGAVATALVSAPLRMPASAGVFRQTAGSVIAAVTDIGLTAVGANAAPAASPEQ
jgi:hypothetical protein